MSIAACRVRAVTAFTVMLGIWAWTIPTASHAVTGCAVSVTSTDGTIKVSASSTSSALRWGTASGAETTAFANAATSISGTTATNCQLGAAGTLAAKTAPAACTIYLRDGASSCSLWVTNCSPGVRLRDVSFAATDPRIEAVSLEDGGATLRFSGVNVQVVSGSGTTSGTINGKGNLFVGYNVPAGTGPHTGSHNLIVGDHHTYSSYGGLAVGDTNTVSAGNSVAFGYSNVASGLGSAVTGGALNKATGPNATVSGGYLNQSAGTLTTVSGGAVGYAIGLVATVSGGLSNVASGGYAAVSGGETNTASGNGASVSGGENRSAVGEEDWVAGEFFSDD